MTDLLDDTTLLAALGEVLAPAPAVPGADAMAALHRALDDRAAAAAAVNRVIFAITSRGK